MDKIKEYKGVIAVTLILPALSYFQKEVLWIVLLVYGLGIYFLINASLSKKIRAAIAAVLWTTFLITTVLFYYSNHHFPKGPMYNRGDVVCQNDDRGPCREKYIEDTRNLYIPEWAKFFKGSGGEMLWFTLLLAAGLVSARKNTNKSEE